MIFILFLDLKGVFSFNRAEEVSVAVVEAGDKECGAEAEADPAPAHSLELVVVKVSVYIIYLLLLSG